MGLIFETSFGFYFALQFKLPQTIHPRNDFYHCDYFDFHDQIIDLPHLPPQLVIDRNSVASYIKFINLQVTLNQYFHFLTECIIFIIHICLLTEVVDFNLQCDLLGYQKSFISTIGISTCVKLDVATRT